MAEYTVHFYNTKLFNSQGLDEVASADDLKSAIAKARKRLKEIRRGSAVVMGPYARLEASIAFSKGRLLTRKAK